jgi:exopolyphosphatase/guanosine-5'-triphosphate,3'-diphosphate pyrophosphatase
LSYAVIDLGTNTFHLLLVERNAAGQWVMLHRDRKYVRLAEEGIGRIGPAAFERALEAVGSFKEYLDDAGVAPSQVRAFGTAALRTASNGQELIDEIEARTGIRAEIISGEREARLIYYGVRRAVPLPDNRVLIMDIGGGSVEFIIADRERIHWVRSFPIGVAVLWRRFKHSDPITPPEIDRIEQFLETALSDLWDALERYPTPTLVGASGSFDVVDLFLIDPEVKHPLYGYVRTQEFDALFRMLTASTVAERRQMPNLPPERVDLIVVAAVLIRYVIHRAGLQDLYTSTYAMKEGMLEEIPDTI